MGRINTVKVVVGGLLAGFLINCSEFVLNTFVIGADMEAALRALNLPPIGGRQIGIFVVLGFALGIATVWLYAAIRPRFGPGVPTACYASLAVWFLAYVYPTMFILVMHVFPTTAMCISLVWGLPEIIIAGIAGAWAYTES
jgi:hypothetical protein